MSVTWPGNNIHMRKIFQNRKNAITTATYENKYLNLMQLYLGSKSS